MRMECAVRASRALRSAPKTLEKRGRPSLQTMPTPTLWRLEGGPRCPSPAAAKPRRRPRGAGAATLSGSTARPWTAWGGPGSGTAPEHRGSSSATPTEPPSGRSTRSTASWTPATTRAARPGPCATARYTGAGTLMHLPQSTPRRTPRSSAAHSVRKTPTARGRSRPSSAVSSAALPGSTSGRASRSPARRPSPRRQHQRRWWRA